MKWFKKKARFPETKHVIELAFSIGGKDYYKFADLLNQPYERALTALIYYREVDLNCDHELLERHVKAVDDILNASKIDIYKIKQLNGLLKQRLHLPKHPDLLYKLASVVYFDQEENPVAYDFEYNKQKIEFWKKNMAAKDFFLQKPIVELIPYLKFAEEDFDTFSRMILKFDKKHLEVLSGQF